MSRRSRGRGEDGATMVVAVLVMSILATLSTALLARTTSVLGSIRTGQDYDAALAAADAGISDALFKIDRSAPESWTATGSSGQGTYEYWAVKQDDRNYVVSSLGQVGRSKHGVQVRVSRTAQYPYALFSRQSLHFDGSVAGINFEPINLGLFGSPDRVRIGSNATVVCQGTVDPNVWIDWYQSQSDCDSPKVNRLDDAVDLTFGEPPLPHQPCPADGVFGLSLSDPLELLNPLNPANLLSSPPVTVDGAGGVPYVCRQDVTFRGLIQAVNPPVKIYVLPTENADGTETYHEVDMSLAVVNPLSSAANFQIYKDGPAELSFSTVAATTFRGILVAPETVLTVNGGHLWWGGSINVLGLRVNGAPNVKIGYDFDLENYLGRNWKVSRYREIPSSQAPATIPAPAATTTTTQAPTTTTTPAGPTTTTTAPTATTTTVAPTTSTTAPPATTTTSPPATTTTTPPPSTTTTTACTLNALGLCIL
ncbi:MAG TPA: hypothetical protein VFO65_11535 [Acidimicrobiales bacterium]|nr:hypothetical protein [Acidimicrobiales bacterium]